MPLFCSVNIFFKTSSMISSVPLGKKARDQEKISNKDSEEAANPVNKKRSNGFVQDSNILLAFH
jgi:hypothetical protein